MSSSAASTENDANNWREFLLIVTVMTIGTVVGLNFLLQSDSGLAFIVIFFTPILWFASVWFVAAATLRTLQVLLMIPVALVAMILGALQLRELL